MKGPRVVIAHSWSPNVGDMAVLSATVAMLKGIATHADITALVSHPEFTSGKCPRLGIRLEGWPWPIPGRDKEGIPRIFRYPVIYLSHLLSVLAYRLFKARIFLFNKEFSRPLEALFDCDVVLSPGGDFISPSYGFMTTLSEFMFAKALGKRVVICAQTIGPFDGFLNGKLAAFALNQADLLLIREEETVERLKRIGVRDTTLTADIVFSFKMPPRQVRRKRQVVICAERVASGSMRRIYLERIAELGRRVKDELELDIILMAANGGDVEFQRELAERLGSRARMIPEIPPPEEAAAILAESEFLISGRMHPIVLGTLSGTPFFAIGDSFKYGAVLGALCDGCWMKVRALDGGDAVDAILARIREREKLRRTIAGRLPAVRARSMMNAAILGRKFAEWGF
jgi:polysaccharide pyruvyl transferase WcaK-like protein